MRFTNRWVQLVAGLTGIVAVANHLRPLPVRMAQREEAKRKAVTNRVGDPGPASSGNVDG